MSGRLRRVASSVAFLVFLALAGFVVGSGYLGGGSPAPPSATNQASGSGAIPPTSQSPPPMLVVSAQIANYRAIYDLLSDTLDSAGPSLYAPLVGISIFVLKLGVPRAKPFAILTNDSGIAEAAIGAGSYSVSMHESAFSVSFDVEGNDSKTTYVSVVVNAVFLVPDAVFVPEPAGIGEILPWENIWFHVESPYTLQPGQPIFLVNGGSKGYFDLFNATVGYSYLGGTGEWVLAKPVQYGVFGFSGITKLFVYAPTYEVKVTDD